MLIERWQCRCRQSCRRPSVGRGFAATAGGHALPKHNLSRERLATPEGAEALCELRQPAPAVWSVHGGPHDRTSPTSSELRLMHEPPRRTGISHHARHSAIFAGSCGMRGPSIAHGGRGEGCGEGKLAVEDLPIPVEHIHGCRNPPQRTVSQLRAVRCERRLPAELLQAADSAEVSQSEASARFMRRSPSWV